MKKSKQEHNTNNTRHLQSYLIIFKWIYPHKCSHILLHIPMYRCMVDGMLILMLIVNLDFWIFFFIVLFNVNMISINIMFIFMIFLILSSPSIFYLHLCLSMVIFWIFPVWTGLFGEISNHKIWQYSNSKLYGSYQETQPYIQYPSIALNSIYSKQTLFEPSTSSYQKSHQWAQTWTIKTRQH